MALVSASPPLSEHKSPYNFVLFIADNSVVLFVYYIPNHCDSQAKIRGLIYPREMT